MPNLYEEKPDYSIKYKYTYNSKYLRNGDWRCCEETQFGRRTMCRKCGVFKTIT